MTEQALLVRRESCAKSEQSLYTETRALSKQAVDIVKTLSLEDQKVLELYFNKTSLIANHECEYLYLQGAKDCVILLKRLGIL